MTLGLTEEHLQLAETVSAWAQRYCPPEVVRAAADGSDSGSAHYLQALAPGLAEQGLLGLHVPDEDGGQGYGLPELAVALEELGRALLKGLDRRAVTSLAAILLGAEASGIAAWATRRHRVCEDPSSVRPADRPVPGGQAPLRTDADGR